MLFHSSIRKELAHSFGATLVVLVTVVMTMMLIRTLGQASKGSVNPSDVMMVMAYTVLGQLPTILDLSLFVAIVGTLSRMYRDSEMVIWFSSGRGLFGFLAPMLRFGWPVVLVVTLLSLFVWPWANQRVQDMKQQYERRGDIDRVAPGQFQESASGNRVFFVDKDMAEDKRGSNVFIASSEHGIDSITTARSARVQPIKNDRFVMLTNGQRQERSASKPGTKISEFEEYGTRIGKNALDDQDDAGAKTLTTRALISNPTAANLAELAWRLSLSLAAFNIIVIALAIAMANPRAGRSGSLVFALFAFIVYYNLIVLGQAWIASTAVGFTLYLAILHGGVLMGGLLLLAKRHSQWSLTGTRHATPVAPGIAA
jgi:lipopolysaccharide export system permease protein